MTVPKNKSGGEREERREEEGERGRGRGERQTDKLEAVSTVRT